MASTPEPQGTQCGSMSIIYGKLVPSTMSRQQTNCCEWDGVLCNPDGSVKEIDCPSRGYAGVVPPELGQLDKLEKLVLSNNKLTGTIPAKLGSLSNLRRLWLSGNQLTGTLPAELDNLGNLQDLALHSNQLTGSIPAELGRLGNLEQLYLGDNQLTGSIPAELGNLSKLYGLDLRNNALTGRVPQLRASTFCALGGTGDRNKFDCYLGAIHDSCYTSLDGTVPTICPASSQPSTAAESSSSSLIIGGMVFALVFAAIGALLNRYWSRVRVIPSPASERGDVEARRGPQSLAVAGDKPVSLPHAKFAEIVGGMRAAEQHAVPVASATPTTAHATATSVASDKTLTVSMAAPYSLEAMSAATTGPSAVAPEDNVLYLSVTPAPAAAQLADSNDAAGDGHTHIHVVGDADEVLYLPTLATHDPASGR